MKYLFEILTVLSVVLIWRTSCVSGELTILQGPPLPTPANSSVMTRRLVCVSEDDSSALAWNVNPEYYNDTAPKIEFVDSSTKPSEIDCSFDGKDDCIERWNPTRNWNITSSYKTPIGPVMDRRWEGLPPYLLEESQLGRWIFRRCHEGTNIFSVRGTIRLKIQFCVESPPLSCFWIAIGGKMGSVSFIRESMRDSEFHDGQRILGTECQGPQIARQQAASSLSIDEWKTLTVKHSEENKTVTVYDEAGQLLSCRFTEWRSYDYINFRSPINALLRHHNYEYLHTTYEHEQLLSSWRVVVGSNICVEMVIGLCTGCKMTINVTNEKGHQTTMGHIFPKISPNGDGLPQWQHVRLNKSVQDSFGKKLRFLVETPLLKYDPSPLWAVAHIQLCKDGDPLRTATISNTQVWSEERQEFLWPEVSCEKISYNGTSLVRSNHIIQHELKHDMLSCEQGKVGPHCAMNCSSIDEDPNCRGLSICNFEGCTCASGWRGENCNEEVPADLTVKSLAKGVVILTWSYPWETNIGISEFNITIERIASDLRKELSQEEKSYKFYSISKHEFRCTKRLYLLPSTKYKFTVCRYTFARQKECIDAEASTPSALAFESDLKIAGNRSDHKIQVKLPPVSNDTSDSIMHIIVEGEVFCKNRSHLSGALTSLKNLTDFESAWIAASFEMVDMKEQHFTIGDNRMNKGILNCPLIPGETYDIVVVVQAGMKSAEKETIVSNFLRVKLPKESSKPYLIWLIGIPIIVVLVSLTYYSYRKRNVTLSQNDDITVTYHETGNPDGPYVVPREPRRLDVHKPQSRKKSKQPNYLELVDDTNPIPAGYEYIQLVKIGKFEEYVKETALNGHLAKEYALFTRKSTKTSDYGNLPENKTKNRTENIVASDDDTRVILKKLPGHPHSDYINASYIRGYKRVNAYIATQWPLLQTLRDFWRMIWQEDVHNICLLSNIIEGEKRKYEQYWPEVGTERTYGEVIVINIGHNVFGDYTIRTLQLTYRQRTRKIKHLHFNAWPDSGIPLHSHSVVTFLREVLALSLGDGPLVVQSGGGGGRTGIIILCDICLRRAAVEGVIDVFSQAEELRKQRPKLLNNKQQYLLAHLAIAGCLVAPQTTLPCDASLPSKMQRMKEQIDVLEQRLRDDAWQDDILHPERTQTPLSTQDLAKNRYPEIAPDGDSRIFLERYPNSDENSDYISAVHVDGVKFNKQYLATQLPLPSTLSDFWRMMAEQEVELIVMLQEPDPQDSTCCEIIQGKKFNPVPHLTISAVTDCESDTKHYTRHKVQLSDSSEEPTRSRLVTILKCKRWECGLKREPPSPDTLVALWIDSAKIPRGGPAAAVCHDGLTGCGLYLTMSFLLERMSGECVCDVYTAIRAVRRSRPEFIQTKEQIEFLHDAAGKYMEYFETYSNFK